MRTLEELAIASDWSSFSKARKRKNNIGISTSIPGLDRYLGGLPGLTVIQGEPGSNKSTLCLQIASSLARKGHPVFMIDCENGKNRLRFRLISQLNQLGQPEVFGGTDEEEQQWEAQLNVLPMFVENQLEMTDSEQTKSGIIDILRQLHGKYKKPVLFIADSLQALPPFNDDARLNIEAWIKFMDSIKVIADGIVHVIVTSEKRRGTYDAAFKDGGKGSGTIEYKAETVLDLRKDPEKNCIILACTKNRDGEENFILELHKKKSEMGNFCFLLEEQETF
jgi:predicted ATP-dependent serine protease